MRDQRVHILTSGGCVNDCVFCMDDKTLRRFITLEQVEKDLREGRAYADEVCFTSGEPTIHPKIVEMVAAAKKAGYRRVQIMSNGRKFSDMRFAAALADAGMTDFMISIHGHAAALHDRIVKRPGAFAETVAGMVNVARIKAARPGTMFSTTTTVFTYNAFALREIVLFLERFPLDALVLNTVIPQQEAVKNARQVLMRYSEIAEKAKGLVDIHEKYRNIRINGFPYCLGEEIRPLLGYREAILYREGKEKHSLSSDHARGASVEGAVAVNGKSKRDACAKCRHFRDCEGVWDSYLGIFGWDEFQPVAP